MSKILKLADRYKEELDSWYGKGDWELKHAWGANKITVSYVVVSRGTVYIGRMWDTLEPGEVAHSVDTEFVVKGETNEK